MSQCLLSPESDIAHWGGFGAKLYMDLEAELEKQTGTREFGGKAGGWGGETVNEQNGEGGKHIGEIVVKTGARGGKSCQNRSRTPALS